MKQISDASMLSTYSLSGDSFYLAILIKRNVRLKVTFKMNFYTEDNQIQKYLYYI